uniref:Transmembrane protein n=1 Tax=Steinernema glaseri TaxID=37863 RepID=A0A1I7ZTS3_9BILA
MTISMINGGFWNVLGAAVLFTLTSLNSHSTALWQTRIRERQKEDESTIYCVYGSPAPSHLRLRTTMEALPAELVVPIVKLVNPESLLNLKSILHPNTPWSLSVDHALEPRFDLYVTVLYLRGFDCMQLHVNKKMQDGRIVSYAPQDDDAYNIDGLMFTVGQTEPGLSSFYSHLVRNRADCLARVRQALQLMNSSRRLEITIEHLDKQPGDLLDLLPRRDASLQVSLDTVRCSVLPPFDIPIRLHLRPFVGPGRSDYLSIAQGRYCLWWLITHWECNINEEWDSEIAIPMAEDEDWQSVLKEFQQKSPGTYERALDRGRIYVRYVEEDRTVIVSTTHERHKPRFFYGVFLGFMVTWVCLLMIYGAVDTIILYFRKF